jgi:hypothetical protein
MHFVANCAKYCCLQFDININMVADYHHYVIDNLKTLTHFLFRISFKEISME